VLVSCKKDKTANDGKVALYSFGPTGAKHGDTLRFIGVNLNKVSSIQFTGENAVIEKKDFTLQTSELIKLIVPSAAEKGNVTLKTADGDIVSKTQLNLDVLTTVASVTAQARPGDNITIKGNYLNWVDKVTFGINKSTETFVSKSMTQIVVKVPDDAQTGTLILHYAGTDPADIETVDTLKVTLPVGTSVSPNPVKHASNVTITGTDLDLVRKVTFEGESTPVTTFVSQSANQLVVKVPRSATKGKLKFEPGSGIQQTVGSSDLDLVLPAVTSLSPNPVDTATNLTISGTNLDLVDSVKFVGVAKSVSTFAGQSATQLVVRVPGGTQIGKITLYVKNSTLSVKSADDLNIVGLSVPPVIIYDDAITSAWNGWIGGGWGGAKDLNNTTNVKSGAKSIKIDYTSGGYGVPLQLGGANISLDGYTSLKLSVYADATAAGKSINIGFNEQDGKTVTLAAGWNDLNIPLSQISPATTLSFLYIKNYTASGDFTIYVDDIGIY
jgi:hypothetical protein